MSLFEHLKELRSRLLKCTLSVAVIGLASLVFARPIFGLLMRPVLAALPAESRALVYTSGIEEINVLMKVGLYAGLFVSMPVILWQLWGFVSPGLYPAERRYTGPFVAFGSIAFLVGTLFCYWVLLPSMFQFLLQTGDSGALHARLDRARLSEQEAIRFFRIGDWDRAGDLARVANTDLLMSGEGQPTAADAHTEASIETSLRLEGLGRLVDAVGEGAGVGSRAMIRKVLEKRLLAMETFGKADFTSTTQFLDEAAAVLATAVPSHGAAVSQLWKLDKDIAAGQTRYAAQTWTRPMLTMTEQLSLVLLLELAFGVIFELPVVMALLGALGLVTAKWLMRYQRHAFVVCLILAAVITPTGDAVNLALMAGPMLLCFEMGVLAVWLIEKRKQKSAASAITPAG